MNGHEHKEESLKDPGSYLPHNELLAAEAVGPGGVEQQAAAKQQREGGCGLFLAATGVRSLL